MTEEITGNKEQKKQNIPPFFWIAIAVLVVVTAGGFFAFNFFAKGQTNNLAGNAFVKNCNAQAGYCTDSDGGHSYFTKGTTKCKLIATLNTYIDYCTWTPQGKQAVVEYFCNGNYQIYGETAVCNFGCTAGHCKRTPLG